MKIRRAALGEQKEGAVAAGDIGRLDRTDWLAGVFAGGGGMGEASAHAAAPENVLVLSFTHQARVITQKKKKTTPHNKRCYVGDRSFWRRQSLFWPYYTRFSMGAVSQKVKLQVSYVAYLPHINFRDLRRHKGVYTRTMCETNNKTSCCF